MNILNYFTLSLVSLQNLINAIEFNNHYSTIFLKKLSNKLLLLLFMYLKKSSLFRFNNLTDLTVIDNPMQIERFNIYMIMTSIEFNVRLAVSAVLEKNVFPSLVTIYPNSNWLEREARDMFGIYFTENPDLRRLLTDYGFEGFPLRKDFPLAGYFEVHYDDELQRISYDNVELSQDFRIFTPKSPWEINLINNI